MSPVSPVKRVTRARAAARKAAIEDSMNARPKKVTITKSTATRKSKVTMDDAKVENVTAARPAAKQSVTAAPLAAAPRRRVKVTPLDQALSAPNREESMVTEEPAIAKATTTKSKKTETTAAPSKVVREEALITAVNTKGRPKKETTVRATNSLQKAEPGKPRGRPKKAAVEQVQMNSKAQPMLRQTRNRAGSGATAARGTVASLASSAPPKKVTFQDLLEDDKENVPVLLKRATTKKEAPKTASGMRAKPLRKPVVTGGRRATPGVRNKRENTQPRALTPKKITQIARPLTPDSDEDELNGAKTPVRDLSMSPTRSVRTTGFLSPVKKLDFTPALRAESPNRAPEVSSLASPARRPPQSPFKDALKTSPKRGDAVPIFPTATLQPSGASIFAADIPSRSTLLQSPRRGPLDDSVFAQSSIKPQKSPFKASLMQSPARRLFSLQKPKQLSTTPATNETSAAEKPSTLSSATPPDTTASCNFRSLPSPERFGRVHTLTEDELVRESNGMLDFDDSVLNIRSPMKLAKPVPIPMESTPEDEDVHTVNTVENNEAETAVDQIQLNDDCQPPQSEKMVQQAEQPESDIESMEGIVLAHTSFEGATPIVTQVEPKFLFHASRFRDEDDSSEDELHADETLNRPLAAGRSSLTGVNLRSGIPNGTTQGFTPLAAQMSGWLASSPDKKRKPTINQHRGVFSPLAAQHVPGEVTIDRQSTPQSLKASRMRYSVGGRKSMAGRSSLAPSMVDTPGKPTFFTDEMSITENEALQQDETVYPEEIDLHDAMDQAAFVESIVEEDHGRDRLDEDSDASQLSDHEEGLTTDLINQFAFTDTAVLDFDRLAKEAEALAPATEQSLQDSSASSDYGDENAVPFSSPSVQESNDIANASGTPQNVSTETEADVEADSPDPLYPSLITDSVFTPIRPNPSLARYVNTVVSKVPIRPEGYASPIKMSQKRSRSLSADESTAKRPLLTADDLRLPKSNTVIPFSPERLVRSAAPSPARSTAISTPGQISFTVEDFGDSTLDGFDIPESDDELLSNNEVNDDESLATATPTARIIATPVSIHSSLATPARRSPLKAVGPGILHGAIVHVDVHTTEGADASGIFVELLTQMGAKCVREWRWNPRTSVAASEESDGALSSAKVGITHVVYKDGGKRTLEKVRDAKGEVWCVGVGWVLDCERENKWLDEASYAVDTTVLPRGGSRRRKSMEPRALINANGNLTAGRRSVSAEMTEEMKQELVNTAIRTPASAPAKPQHRDSPLSQTASVSVDSGFSTPTGVQDAFQTSTRSVASEEAALDDDADAIAISTPTGFVSYDPATSGSPTTPYLMGQGSKLIQMTCPPKQTNKGLFDDEDKDDENEDVGLHVPKRDLFPVMGQKADEENEGMRKRLEAARRRTVGPWRPRVASPLGR